ncbi:MAG: hypothetical protein WCO35_02055 [Candidatus Nomurabacteria bacterium]
MIKNSYKKISWSILIIFLAIAKVNTFAITDGTENLKKLGQSFTDNVLTTAGTVLMTAAFVVFFYGVVMFLIGRVADKGDLKSLEKGKEFMLWGLIALFVMVTAWGIITFVQSTLGLQGGNIKIQPLSFTPSSIAKEAASQNPETNPIVDPAAKLAGFTPPTSNPDKVLPVVNSDATSLNYMQDQQNKFKTIFAQNPTIKATYDRLAAKVTQDDIYLYITQDKTLTNAIKTSSSSAISYFQMQLPDPTPEPVILDKEAHAYTLADKSIVYVALLKDFDSSVAPSSPSNDVSVAPGYIPDSVVSGVGVMPNLSAQQTTPPATPPTTYTDYTVTPNTPLGGSTPTTPSVIPSSYTVNYLQQQEKNYTALFEKDSNIKSKYLEFKSSLTPRSYLDISQSLDEVTAKNYATTDANGYFINVLKDNYPVQKTIKEAMFNLSDGSFLYIVLISDTSN